MESNSSSYSMGTTHLYYLVNVSFISTTRLINMIFINVVGFDLFWYYLVRKISIEKVEYWSYKLR